MSFQSIVRDFYNSRLNYDNVATISRATTLVNFFPPKSGDSVLDLATGTGNVAFRAGEIVGPTGKVIGLDIAEELLRIAKAKKAAGIWNNVDFRVSDVCHEVFSIGSIDAAYCSFAIMLIDDIDGFLTRISAGLSEGGFFAFTSTSTSSYLNNEIAQAGALSGVTIPPVNERFGDPERIAQRLRKSGMDIEKIHELQLGRFIELEDAKAKWDGKFWIHPEQTLEGIHESIARTMKIDFDKIVAAKARDGFVWFEEKVYFVKSVKAD
jgi:SAM-dependent methyltransferase